jgi:hypothetical protein
MSRRPAQITQADIRRIIRAAKMEGAPEVLVQLGDTKVLIRLSPSGGEGDIAITADDELEQWRKRKQSAHSR